MVCSLGIQVVNNQTESISALIYGQDDYHSQNILCDLQLQKKSLGTSGKYHHCSGETPCFFFMYVSVTKRNKLKLH